jgi:Cu(I)/Ag(I) efflux system protein CusF
MNMGDVKGMEMGQKPGATSPQQVHVARGTVKKADAKGGQVALVHEPVASLNWPAMTMSFRVQDKKLWNKLREGKKVEVEFVQDGKDYVIAKVK